jgi:glycosyltransferase involved in cell wall biosynthesis
VRVLYLINAYPRVSHTFIRREIQALETIGIEIIRVSCRPLTGIRLVDAADVAEAQKTRVLLQRGALGLLPDVCRALLLRPLRSARALAETLRLSRQSEAGLLRHFGYLAEACAVARIAAQTGAGHVHAHFGTNPPVIALLAERLGAPGFSFTVHGPEEFDRARGLKLTEKIAAARFTVAISSFGRAQLRRFAKQTDHDRIHVVHCGLDAEFLERPGAIARGGRTLLFVGRLCAQKEPLLLVDAAARLAAEGVDFHLRVAGTGELEAELRQRIQKAGLGEHITLLGPLDGAGVQRELEACRALVLPSSAEGLPVVLMEALACQRPVVTTFVAGIPELVRDGREGWLCPAGDVEALAQALKAALNSTPEELQRLGYAGALRVRRRHDVRESARRLVELFTQHSRTSAPKPKPTPQR